MTTPIQIEFCKVWNYEPEALRAKAQLEALGHTVELIPGGGGVFEITVNGELKYSKKRTGRFPTDDEVNGVV